MLQKKKEVNNNKKYNNQIKQTANQFYTSICSKTQKVLHINNLTYCEIQLTPTHDVIKECAFYNDLKIEDRNLVLFNGKKAS